LEDKHQDPKDEESKTKADKCYKVITQDKVDEMVHIQASLMMGTALEISVQHKQKTKWTGQLGVLSSK